MLWTGNTCIICTLHNGEKCCTLFKLQCFIILIAPMKENQNNVPIIIPPSTTTHWISTWCFYLYLIFWASLLWLFNLFIAILVCFSKKKKKKSINFLKHFFTLYFLLLSHSVLHSEMLTPRHLFTSWWFHANQYLASVMLSQKIRW